jgi:hypothetical protein
MSANNTTNSAALIRSELWQRQLEETLHEKLTGTPYVRQLDFPDGDSFTLPSIGTATVRNLPEDTEVTFDALDTGEQSFTLQDPVVAATSISEVFLEDSLWSADLLSAVPVEHSAAIMERFESDVFSLANTQAGGVGDGNALAGVDHRRKGHGTNGHIDPSDFAYAGYALKKAKLPNQNLIAIVSPSVAYDLETLSTLVDVSNNPRWEGIVDTGITQNMRFVKNVYGFDVFESNLLASTDETLDGYDFSTNGGVANIFMSAAREMILPFAIAWRRRAQMQREFDFRRREEQIVTTARWGSQLVRSDNLVVTVTEDTVA